MPSSEDLTVIQTSDRVISRAVDVQAPHEELFDIVADPRRHSELDGATTVMSIVRAPERLSDSAKFTVNMKQFGLPYRITSRVTQFKEGTLLEWRHPAGHRWRWEFAPLTPSSTRVTETWNATSVNALTWAFFRLTNVPTHNTDGIEATLNRLRARYS